MSQGLPITISYPPELPVSAAREELARAIRDHQVVIVAGATGSGKTTQLPKICLELGRERIGHTQPRRIAARSIAARISEELGVELGALVGYQVRFDDRSTRDTRIKLMTDGVLLAELNRDRELRRYDTIILDEAHERSLTIDFLLGYLKQLLPRRPELKVIVTSATIDPESFAKHFADAAGTPAPIVEVSGRTYPVEIRYRPLVAERLDESDDPDDVPSDDRDYLDGITDALAELAREEPGDVLVFLSGETEIRDAEDAIRGRFGPATGTEVLPLYGRLSTADQHRVFETGRAPGIRRRVVLATNVAETSLTVPGIKYVIDAGTARISRYSARAKVQRLPIEAISQASANQRSGRAGRTSDGIAIRLYSEEDFTKRPAFTDPEILRTNLAAVILQMISIGLGDIAAFPFLQPPDSRGIQDGVDLLRELNAISVDRTTGHTRITPVGRDLAALPLDPRFGRMLVEAKRNGVVREVAAIVAGLSIQDVRERPLEKRAQADQLHARFADPTSDFLGLLKLWNHLEEQQRALSSSAFRRLCKAEFLNYLRVREWQDLDRQLIRAGHNLGIKPGEAKVDGDAIHKSLLAGLLSRIGLRDERVTKTNPKEKAREGRESRSREYLGARNQRFAIFPGSALARKGPPAVMAAELVETSRLYARTAAAIDPAWAEPLAGDLVKRSYGEPRWEKRQGSAVADEKVTLYGVPIVPKRRLQLARIDPEQARELFIRHALVDGDWPYSIERNGLFDFDRANRALRDELSEVEERTRRRDILIDDEAVVEFYDRRIPADVTDVRRFETWWKAARAATPGLLTMARDDLLDEVPDAELDGDAFPGEWIQGEQRMPLRYRFEPGADDDGVTVEIPLALLARLEPRGFDWLVPGLREELVTALLKTLPKAIRRNVVPAADWARRLLSELPEHAGSPLLELLAQAIRTATHTVVAPSDFDVERLAPHLRMTFAAVDERGRRVASSKSLAELQARLGERSRQSVAKVTVAAAPRSALERSGLTTWDVDELPSTLDTRISSGSITGYPSLVDEGASVAIRVFGTAADQQREHALGVRRLLALTLPSPLSYVQEHLTGAEKLQLATSPYRSTAALLDDALLATIDELVDAATAEHAPFTRAGFEALRDEVSGGLVDGLFATVALAAKVLGAAREADRAISNNSSLGLMAPLADARSQLDALVHPGFLRLTGVRQLRRVPVYLAGIVHRVGKLAENPGRDRVWLTEVEQATELYRAAGGRLPLTRETPPSLVAVRWMLEELRLSLFAQQIGAAGPVSVARIRKALA
ncbi:ATP-dependent RNA helicase HrpA [Lysinimonas soli]|uniref:ATP-dependent RNA helicase HrpA n=1 Tax=Lysinimonas soli TaxID=1074233 RepID=A0ABW0NLB4_9MICO